jgi:hypothetical protein
MADTNKNFVIAAGILLNTALIAHIIATCFIIEDGMALKATGTLL